MRVFVQVRMYQFSATPKHIECVVFECVGGRDNNQGLDIKVCCAVPRCRAWMCCFHPQSTTANDVSRV